MSARTSSEGVSTLWIPFSSSSSSSKLHAACSLKGGSVSRPPCFHSIQ
jgi:hypothetical protein